LKTPAGFLLRECPAGVLNFRFEPEAKVISDTYDSDATGTSV
jgi:hypothetical protein